MSLVAERVDARERSAAFWAAVGEEAFAPWLIHADPATEVWWERVRAWWPQFDIVLTDAPIERDGDDPPETAGAGAAGGAPQDPVAAAWGVPIAWDGTPADLPAGYTDTLRRAVEGHEGAVVPDTFVVCAAVVLAGRTRTGLAATLLAAMRDLPAAAHLTHVLVPVRPTSKASYPLTPIETYVAWRRPDGLPLDPWLRTHARLGGRVLACAPRSQTLSAPIAQWEEWSGLALPSSGPYVIPGGMAPLHVQHEDGRAVMVEPNVWVQHR